MPARVTFELFLAFWTDRSNDGNLERTPVANFSGVLGIDPSTLAFRKPYNYTTNLSALIWVGRLLLLEYALPLRPYLLTKVQILARDSYSDYGQRLCSDVRPLHLQRGSMSPIGYLIERLQHGRAIAKREGPRPLFDGPSMAVLYTLMVPILPWGTSGR